MPMGYYGAPQVAAGKNYDWAHNHYVAGWRLLRDRADWGGAGYDFSMRSMRNTYDALGHGRFIPWYMVTENYNERWRRYRKISANLTQHLMASGMNGYAIWYFILDNGAFHDAAEVNDMLSEYGDILSGENETPSLLALSEPPRGEYASMVYSIGDKHVAVVANIDGNEYHSKFFWRGCETPPATTLRRPDGSTVTLKEKDEVVVPPHSFVTLSSEYHAGKVDPLKVCEDVFFEASFDKSGEKTFYLKDISDVENCEVSAVVSVSTDSSSFGKVGIVARESGNERIVGGIILSKGIVWAQGGDELANEKPRASTLSNYIRHGKELKNQHISLSVNGNLVVLKVGGKKFTYQSAVSKAGKIGFQIKALAPGRCVVRKFKLTRKTKQAPAKKKKKRGRRELKKGAPQV
jgi:hypothetical protein